MAVLDAFEIVFGSDTKKLEKGTEDAKKSTEKLKTALVDTDSAAKSLGETFFGLMTDAQGKIASLISVGATITSVIAQATKVDALGKFSDTIDANIEDIGAWGEAVRRHGGSAEGFQGTIKSLTDSMTQLALTGSGPSAEAFAKLGISAFDAGGKLRSAFDILPDIADSFEALSKAEAVALGQQLGLDQGTILLLQQGRVSVEELIRRQKELGVATEEDAEAAKAFNNAWMDTQQVFSSLVREVGFSLLPAFTGILDFVGDIVNFLRNNQEIVQAFFIGAALTITKMYLPAITAAALKTGLAILPFIKIGAVVLAAGTAFALLYEDLMNFLDGQDSVMGAIAERWPIAGNIIRGFAEGIKFLITYIKELTKWLTGSFVEGIKDGFNWFKRLIDLKGENREESEKELELLKEIDRLNRAQSDLPPIYDALNAGQHAIESANDNPLATSSPEEIMNNTNRINKNTSVSVGAVNVHTQATDADSMASDSRQALQEQLEVLISDNDDGLAY